MPNSERPGYFERDVTNTERILFVADRGLQSSEMNDLQNFLVLKHASLARSLFQDGQILRGAEITTLPPGTEHAGSPVNLQLADGDIFMHDTVYAVAGEQINIPFDAKVAVGIRYRTFEVDENTDIGLRDPAEGTRNYQEPGAARLKCEYRWGWSTDDSRRDTYEGWDFFPIYEVDHGVIVKKVPPPTANPFTEALARYDREAHGNYVVRGLSTQFVEETDTSYVYDVMAGLANIQGYKVELLTSRRMVYAKDSDVRAVNNEPHVATVTDGVASIFTNRTPIFSVGEVIVTKEKTVTLTHEYGGSTESLPDPSIVQVLEVKQGGTTYAVTTDYLVLGDDISWAPSGAEPAPSSSYTVKYRYLEAVVPENVYRDRIEVSGVVDGGLVQIDYTYKLPRKDLLVLDRNTNIAKLVGISQTKNPEPPIPSETQIGLATIEYDWINDPVVQNVFIRAVHMSEIEYMQVRLEQLYDLVAIERLKTNAALSDPSSKYGVFVDPFLDDDLRDAGRVQTAAIFDGELTLPIGNPTDGTDQPQILESSATYTDEPAWLLPFDPEVVLQQPTKTGAMKINPYQAFDPIPAQVTLDPAVDHWTLTVDSNAKSLWVFGGVTGEWHPGHTSGPTQLVTTTQNVLLRESAKVSEFVRVRNVKFTVKGFGSGETLAQLKFDGVDVTASVV